MPNGNIPVRALDTGSAGYFIATGPDNFAEWLPFSVADLPALKAVTLGQRTDGLICTVFSDTAGEVSRWRYSSASTAADTSENLVVTPTDTVGRWLRADRLVSLSLAVTKDTADNAVIFTVPVGAKLRAITAWWDVDTSWSGGAASAIGVHASATGFTTPGDILGGAAGDVAATLVSTNTRMVGTVGTKLTPTDRLILIAADTLRFDRIVDAFTAGVGKVRVTCEVLKNPGA